MSQPISYKYFDHGTVNEKNSAVQYGLYQPVLDCFLLTTADLDIAKQLVMVASSRYDLQICNLSTAENYAENLIDNQCCHNWTLSNKNEIFHFKSYTKFNPIKIKKLLETNGNVEWDLQEETQWLLMVTHWLVYIRVLHENSYEWDYIDSFMHKVFKDQIPGSINQQKIMDIESEILKILYLGIDFGTADTEIKELIQQDEFLNHWYKMACRA